MKCKVSYLYLLRKNYIGLLEAAVDPHPQLPRHRKEALKNSLQAFQLSLYSKCKYPPLFDIEIHVAKGSTDSLIADIVHNTYKYFVLIDFGVSCAHAEEIVKIVSEFYKAIFFRLACVVQTFCCACSVDLCYQGCMEATLTGKLEWQRTHCTFTSRVRTSLPLFHSPCISLSFLHQQ